MFSTSGDVLNLVLAVCILLLTVFLCVALYYLISSMKKTHRVIKVIESTLSKAEDVINLTKDRIKNSGTYFMLFGELVKKLMDYFISKPSRKYKVEKEEDYQEEKKEKRNDAKKVKTGKNKTK